MSFFSKLLHNKKRRSLLGLIIVLLLLFFLFRSSPPFLGEKVYFIGVDSQWKDIHLYGKEKNFLAFSQSLLTEASNLYNY